MCFNISFLIFLHKTIICVKGKNIQSLHTYGQSVTYPLRPCLLHQGVGLAQGDPPAWLVLPLGARGHPDAVNDGTHADTQGAPSAVRGHTWEVRLGVKGDGLVAGVVADHVTLATVDAHVLVNDCHSLLRVVQGVVGSDAREGPAYHVLRGEWQQQCYSGVQQKYHTTTTQPQQQSVLQTQPQQHNHSNTQHYHNTTTVTHNTTTTLPQ